MTTSVEGFQESAGVEMRVHGAGDHGVFSALGKPIYSGTVADRVRIGSLPLIPKHELKLINWSRPSRRITRTLSWYLAYPFTLLNMAGFMGPEKSRDRREKRLWWFMRTVIVVASLVLTFAMAMWITAIVETAWRLLAGTEDGLSTVVRAIFGPCLLAAFVVNRLVRGHPQVDRGNRWVSLLTFAVLLGTTGYLAGRADRGVVVDFGAETGHDPMTVMVGATTVVAWTLAIVLCAIAWLTEIGRNKPTRTSHRPARDRTALAGAGILIAFAVAILHTAGSGIRLVVQTVLEYTPPVIERRVQGARDGARVMSEAGAYDNTNEMLLIDLIPAFFLVMLAVFGVLLRREYRRRRPTYGPKSAGGFKDAVPVHVLLRDTREFLARTAVVAMVGSAALWCVLAAVVFAVSNQALVGDEVLAPLLTALKIVGLLLLIVIVARRPEHAADRVRRALGSVADVAGFWAPDLHPLAGASYRVAVLRGLRRGVLDARRDQPGKPIALVGHSQGTVICAWFVRGGHWQEKRSETTSDEQALAMGLHDDPLDSSDRIALFTCGSPLGSLYRTFFPRYFDETFFRTALRRSHGNIWHNYWRHTDPIGARLHRDSDTGGDAPRVQDTDVTELEHEAMKGHCEYWQEDRVRRDIEAYFELVERTERPAIAGSSAYRRLRGLRVAFSRLHLHGN